MLHCRGNDVEVRNNTWLYRIYIERMLLEFSLGKLACEVPQYKLNHRPTSRGGEYLHHLMWHVSIKVYQ